MKEARITDYLKPYISSICRGVTIKFFGTIMDLGLPWVLAYIIDNVIPSRNLNQVFAWGGIMFLLSAAAVAGNIIANRIASAVARDTTKQIRYDLFQKILYLSSSDADEFTSPSLISRMTTDTYNIHHMVGMMQRLGIRAPILLIGGIFVTMTLDPVLSGTLIMVLPFTFVLIYIISKKGIPLYEKLQRSVDQMVKSIREDISGIRVIKALSKENYEKDRLQSSAVKVSERETKASVWLSLTNPVMNLLLNMGFCMVVYVGAVRVQNGQTDVGKVVAFTSYFAIILNAILGITRMFVIISKATASSVRIKEVLNTKTDESFVQAKQSVRAASFHESASGEDERVGEPHIAFQNVSFSYFKYNEGNINGTDNMQGSHKKPDSLVLRDISFVINRGESFGIIGSTGSGKTTIINLLMRFYKADAGVVMVDGRNVNDYEQGLLRQKFGTVFQNDILFSDSIEENITFGRSMDRLTIEQAAADAGAKEFIEHSYEGYERRLSAKGSNISGGQKQRLMIARALAGNPEILVLDDSSSALDYKTDAMIRSNLAERYEGVTKIIIAQRISSIMGLKTILVLEEGSIQGFGTHEELMESCAIYQDIYRSQLGGD